ncbi:MAG TPA: M42 family metallopeptidase [Bacillota bacterium]|jgi:endoglucanase
MDTKELLKALSEGIGVSGYEGPVGRLVADAFRPLCDEIRFDKLGNCICLRRGEPAGRGEPGSRQPGSRGGARRSVAAAPAPRVMLAGHMDEVGLMVTKHEGRGFVRFTDVDGVDQRTLPGQEVTIHGRRDVPGVIGLKPPHLIRPAEAHKALKMEDLCIDTGLADDEARRVISVGDVVTLKRRFLELQNGYVAGKAFDDRAGVAVMYEALLQLAKLRHEADVYAVATVQEETGMRGATTSAYGIVPDIGVAIDVTFGDMPGIEEYRTLPLDRGPSLAAGGNIHPRILEAMLGAAEAAGIPIQMEALPGPTGTDAWAMQVTRSGIPTALVSIPLRSMHTTVETAAMGDIRRAGRLLALFIASVDRSFVEGLRW